MSKVITTYLIEEEVKKELRILRAIENKNVSDLLKDLIDNYKKKEAK